MDDRAGIPCDAEDCCANYQPHFCWHAYMYGRAVLCGFKLTVVAGRDPEYLELAIKFGAAILSDRQFLKRFPDFMKRYILLFLTPATCMLTRFP